MRQSERSLGASTASVLGLVRKPTIAAISCHRGQRPNRLHQRLAARKRSSGLLGDVDHDRFGSLVEESLDELGERVRIFKACSRVEAGNLEEFPVALHAPIYPPCPYLLALSPATNFYSGHAGPFFHVGGVFEILARAEVAWRFALPRRPR